MAPSSPRPWPVTAGGYLLAAQGAALIGTGLALGAAYGGAGPGGRLGLAAAGAFGVGLGLAALANAVRFLRRRPDAWLSALILQGLSLTLALTLYWRGHPAYSYPLMAFGVLMVAHLNRGDVVEPMHGRPARPQPDPEPEPEHE